MSPRQITVLGECVADAFTEPANASNELALRVLPGGGPANTAVALARLNTPTHFPDVFGRLFRAHLEASGVDLPYAVAAEPSTLAVAELDATGQAAFSSTRRTRPAGSGLQANGQGWICPKRSVSAPVHRWRRSAALFSTPLAPEAVAPDIPPYSETYRPGSASLRRRTE